MEFIGRNIKHYRVTLGLSQEQVASYLGLNHREQIAHYESGRTEVPVEYLNKLCDLFGIDLISLLEEDEANLKVDAAFAFRADELEVNDLNQIAFFKRAVKNYIKLQRIVNE
jgi:transcriptional regulator with XRE-family HTH domain